MLPMWNKKNWNQSSESEAEKLKAEFEERERYIRSFGGATIHWFFIQGAEAIRKQLYLPGVSCLMNGFEASLRVTITESHEKKLIIDSLSPYRVLSNKLIRQAQEIGMPVHLLAFPDEYDFADKLQSRKPNLVDVEIVRQRNNLCHGNIFEFINSELGPRNAFFTPDCLRQLARNLWQLSYGWADGVRAFRKERNLPCG